MTASMSYYLHNKSCCSIFCYPYLQLYFTGNKQINGIKPNTFTYCIKQFSQICYKAISL